MEAEEGFDLLLKALSFAACLGETQTCTKELNRSTQAGCSIESINTVHECFCAPPALSSYRSESSVCILCHKASLQLGLAWHSI